MHCQNRQFVCPLSGKVSPNLFYCVNKRLFWSHSNNSPIMKLIGKTVVMALKIYHFYTNLKQKLLNSSVFLSQSILKGTDAHHLIYVKHQMKRKKLIKQRYYFITFLLFKKQFIHVLNVMKLRFVFLY